MNNNNISGENQKNDFHLKTEIEKYVSQWPWFLLAICICLFVAFSYLRYVVPQYRTTTTILVKDEKKGGMQSELSAFADMGVGTGLKSNIDNEIEILRSRSLVESTVKKLKFNIRLFVKGKFIKTEIYKNTPIQLDFINSKLDFVGAKMPLEFVEITPNSFRLEKNESDKTSFLLSRKKVFNYGEIIPTLDGDLIITKSKDKRANSKIYNKPIIISVLPFEGVVDNYFGRLKVGSISRSSSVVSISIIDPVTAKAEDFLNNLVQIYDQKYSCPC